MGQSLKMKYIEIEKNKFEKLLAGEKVYFSRKPLRHGVNIFTMHLIQLALHKLIVLPGNTYTAELSKDIDLGEIHKLLINSPLNEHFAIYRGYLAMNPNGNIISSEFSSVLKEAKSKSDGRKNIRG